MTPTDRLIAALRGEPVDRVPVWLMYPPTTHPSYADIHHEPSYAPVIAAARERSEWFHRVGVRGKVVTGGSPPARQVEKTPDREVWEQATPLGTLTWGRERRGEGWLPIPRFKAPADLKKALSLAWEPPDYDFAEFLAALRGGPDWALPMTEFSDAFSSLYSNARHDDLVVWAVTEPDLVDAYLAEMHRRQMHLLTEALKVLARAPAGAESPEMGTGTDFGKSTEIGASPHFLTPVFFLFGSEFAAPPMCSPKTFERVVARYDAEIIASIHAAGGLCPVHHHGDILDLLPIFRDMGADGVQPIEAPPTGDCPIAEIRPRTHARFCVIGNVQYDDLVRHTTAQIRRQVFNLLDACGPRAIIVAPTAGPYEPRITPRMADNYLAMIDATHDWSARHGV